MYLEILVHDTDDKYLEVTLEKWPEDDGTEGYTGTLQLSFVALGDIPEGAVQDCRNCSYKGEWSHQLEIDLVESVKLLDDFLRAEYGLILLQGKNAEYHKRLRDTKMMSGSA